MGKFDNWWGNIGPIYLAFIPAFLFIGKKNRIIKYLLIYFLGGMTFFYFFSPRPGHMLPFFPSLAIVAAYVMERLRENESWLNKILPVFVIFVLVINLGVVSGLFYVRLQVVLGLETDDYYLSRRIEIYDAVLYINENLEKDAKILFSDTRGY